MLNRWDTWRHVYHFALLLVYLGTVIICMHTRIIQSCVCACMSISADATLECSPVATGYTTLKLNLATERFQGNTICVFKMAQQLLTEQAPTFSCSFTSVSSTCKLMMVMWPSPALEYCEPIISWICKYTYLNSLKNYLSCDRYNIYHLYFITIAPLSKILLSLQGFRQLTHQNAALVYFI